MSKIKIKVGDIEIELEGPEDYIKDLLPSSIEMLNEIRPYVDDVHEENEDEEAQDLPSPTDTTKKKLQMTTNSIAAKLKVESASELVIAACAYLYFVKGQAKYKRSDILRQMQSVTNLYKSNHSKNLSQSLNTLVKGDKLLEVSENTYALEAKEEQRIRAKLNGS